MLTPNGRVLLIDSGAFSVWNKGIEISIEKYTSWCLKHLDFADFFVNLDVIPGRGFGKIPDKNEVEYSAKKGWKNFHYMLRAGIPKDRLIHVFHQGEEMHWLERLVEYPYIGLSPANDRSTKEKKEWLEMCMEILIDEKGFPVNKWHGFAVTSLKLIKTFPWYSVDSASWLQSAIRGTILLYLEEKKKLVSVRPKYCVKNRVQKKLRSIIDEKLQRRKLTWEDLAGHSPVFRMKWNIIELNETIQNIVPPWPWKYLKKNNFFL